MQCNQTGQSQTLKPERVKCYGPVTVIITETQFESYKCLHFFFMLFIIHERYETRLVLLLQSLCFGHRDAYLWHISETLFGGYALEVFM